VNITVICPHFAPDVAPTGEVMTSIANELVDRGHRLHVVTSLPWYRSHAVDPGWEGSMVRHEDTEWGRITRLHPFPTDKSDIPARALAFGGFTVEAVVAAAMGRGHTDVVLAMSPPLTLGLAGWAVAKARRVPFVFNIQDVFPDVAIELGAISDRRVIAGAYWLERISYLGADAVTVLSDDLRANVADKISGRRGGDPAKVRVIPNFIDTQWIRPADRMNDYRREFDLGDRTVVMYAGNVGMSQSLDLVIDAAVAFSHDPSVVFVINGGGAARDGLVARARGLTNVRFVDMQPKDRLPEVLAAGDVHVVPLKRGLARSSVPSKLYSILAAGRPVLASVDPGTEVARTIERAEAGAAVDPDDAEQFTKALRRLLESPDDLARMGRSGRSFVEQWASPSAVAAAYEDLFDELIGRRSGALSRTR
jgi:colanic acid biosynthesis glycosyl transferase WcaI